MEIEREGIVKDVKRLQDKFLVELITSKGRITFASNEYVDENEYVRVSLSPTPKGFSGSIVSRKNASKDDFESILEGLRNSIKIDYEPLIKDEVMNKLKEDVVRFAKDFLISSMLGRDAVIHFHHDADGIVSAFAITSIIKGKTFQHNSAIYSVKDALNDIQSLRFGFMPMVINLDFSSNEESREGIDIVEAAGIDVYVIDHHPYAELNANVLNPWKYFENCSKYTAGYLSSEVARAAGKEADMIKVSLAGDKSDLMDVSEEDREKALVLDFLATYNVYGNNLNFYREVLSKKELYSTILIKANEKLLEVREEIKKQMKPVEVKGINIYFVKVDVVARRSEFPSKGKITSQAYELVKDEPVVVIGISERSLIFRLADEAYRKGVSANKMIEKLKERIPHAFESGGGHAKAAALRIRNPDYIPAIKEEIINVVEELINE